MFEFNPELDKQFKATSLVGYGTSTCVIVYGLITYFILKNKAVVDPVSEYKLLRFVIWAVAASTILAIPIFKTQYLKRFFEKHLSAQDMLKKINTLYVIIFAMCETIALFGLVLAIMTKQISDYYSLGFVSLIAFAINFPKLPEWDEWLKNNQMAT